MLRALKRADNVHTGEILDALKGMHDLLSLGLLVPKANLNEAGQAILTANTNKALAVLKRSRKYGDLYAADQQPQSRPK